MSRKKETYRVVPTTKARVLVTEYDNDVFHRVITRHQSLTCP
jgi:hypothetical protein